MPYARARSATSATAWEAAWGPGVVVADEDHRQLPHGGQVDALVEQALVDGAVAEEGNHHPVLAPHVEAERRPGRDGDARADDAVGAQDAEAEIGDVH